MDHRTHDGAAREPAPSDATNKATFKPPRPRLAAFLTWLAPGLGHCVQRRFFKAFVYGLSVWTLVVAGLAMGTYREIGADGKPRLQFARNVYYSRRPGDMRLAFIPQAFVGVFALPAILAARWADVERERELDGRATVAEDDYSFFSSAFAPPRSEQDRADGVRRNQPDADDLAANLNSWLDVGLLYTMTAGLLNLLAIFDAFAGPTASPEEEESKKKRGRKDAENENASEKGKATA